LLLLSSFQNFMRGGGIGAPPEVAPMRFGDLPGINMLDPF
jgi:hypothetical protein